MASGLIHDSFTFPSIPSCYAVVNTRSLEKTTSLEVLRQAQIGINNINFGTPFARNIGGSTHILMPNEEQNFIKARIRNKTHKNLYISDSSSINFLGQTLFVLP